MENLEQRVQIIEDRNKKVEADKAWEVSVTRKVFLALATYAIISLSLKTIGNSSPLVNAIIPTLGFIISTLTIGFLKRKWISSLYKK